MKKKPITEGVTRSSMKGGVQNVVKKATPTKSVRPKDPPPAPKKPQKD